MGVTVLLLVFVLEQACQVYAHEVRPNGERRAQGYLDAPIWAVKLAVSCARPHPGTDANEKLDEVLHGHMIRGCQSGFLYGTEQMV